MSAFAVGVLFVACCSVPYFGLGFLIWKVTGADDEELLEIMFFGPPIVAALVAVIGVLIVGLVVAVYVAGLEVLTALDGWF